MTNWGPPIEAEPAVKAPPAAKRPRTFKENCELIRRANDVSLKFLCTKYLATKDWSKVHDELAAFLKTAGNFIHIELPRGHLKSWIVTKGWAIQQVLKNPNLRVLIVNAVEGNATMFLRTIEKFMGPGSGLEVIYGSFVSDVWNQNELIIRQRTQVLDAPTFAAAGVQKTLTSQHYDIIIADDLVEPANVATPEQRAKIYEFYLSLFDLLEPQGKLVVIGTRYHQADLYSKILEENDDKHNWSTFIRSCYNDDGSVLFPEKFTKERLENIRSKPGGRYHFASQYMNNPIDEESADFKASWIKHYDPTTPHPGSLYLTIDPAISLSRDADFSALVVAGMFSDRRIRVVDSIHRRMVPSDLVDAIFELVKKWRLHRVGIETFAFQQTLKYDVQRKQRESGVFFSIDELGKRHSGRGEQVLSKEARIRRLQPYFEQGLVEIRSDMAELADELLAFPRGRHDDLIDALSYQLDYLVPSMQKSAPPLDAVHGSMGWWVKKLPQPTLSIYDRFLQDIQR